MDFPTIDAAKSALMARWNWDEPRAHRWLQRSAMDTRLSKKSLAELVTQVDRTGRWDRLPELLTELKSRGDDHFSTTAALQRPPRSMP